MHLHDLTIKKFHEGLLKKDFSALEITKEFFDYIEVKDKEIGAYLSLAKDEAFLRAEKADLKIAKDEPMDALSGVPLAIKDNILIDGQPATAASKILENYKAVYDATVIKKLKAVGAVFLGKTNMDEFAMGSSTENPGFKLTKNPYDLERVPGGSSGGSAAAVAAHMAVAAFGSDTGGSIRQPASFCGVVGLKPTYGAVSRHGLIAMASSLDQIGPITKNVEDAALLFEVISGKDRYDATTVAHEKKQFTKSHSLRGVTIGVPKEYFDAGLDPDVGQLVKQAIAGFEKHGANIREVSLPHALLALSAYYIVMPAEVSANLARFDGIRYGKSEIRNPKSENFGLYDMYAKTRREGFGAEVKRRIV